MALASQSRGGLRRYRWKELWLLIIPFMILLLEMIQLPIAQLYMNQVSTGQRQLPFSTALLPGVHDLIPVLGLIAALVALNILMSIFFPKADQMLLPLVGLLSGLGVLMAIRNGPGGATGDVSLGTKQLGWVLLGMVVFVIIMFGLRSLRWLERYKYTWAAVGIVLVGITVVSARRAHVGVLNGPAHDSLQLGPFTFQPSEFLKILIVVFFAAYLSENRDILAEGNIRLGPITLPPLRQLGPLLLMLGVSLVLFLGIPELGLALLIYGIFLAMLYLGSGKLSYALGGLVTFFVLGFIGYALFGYIRARFTAVGLNLVNWQAWGDTQVALAKGDAYQVAQGVIALSSGGILGTGLGLGHAADIVPVVASDMVLTSIGEELGLAGLLAILGIYLLILYRGFRIAMETNNTFHQLLAAGLTSIFAIQALIISAGNLKLIPLTGIPLPFLSYGGSSMIANFIIVGILMRISHNTAREREGLA